MNSILGVVTRQEANVHIDPLFDRNFRLERILTKSHANLELHGQEVHIASCWTGNMRSEPRLCRTRTYASPFGAPSKTPASTSNMMGPDRVWVARIDESV